MAASAISSPIDSFWSWIVLVFRPRRKHEDVARGSARGGGDPAAASPVGIPQAATPPAGIARREIAGLNRSCSELMRQHPGNGGLRSSVGLNDRNGEFALKVGVDAASSHFRSGFGAILWALPG